MIREEHITKAIANRLNNLGWEIILVHPPDGQGPFTIPRPPISRAIERSSYHPDVVALKLENNITKILLVECKLRKIDLIEDITKFRELTSYSEILYFICFRCQKFEGGPSLGVNFEEISLISPDNLPIELGFAYLENTGDLELPNKINSFKCYDLCVREDEIFD